MMFDRAEFVTRCNSSKNMGVKPLLYSLVLNIAFCTLSFASSTTPEINVDYLNELTGPKVTWETATESDPDIVYINGAYYKYTYHKPDDYTETDTRAESLICHAYLSVFQTDKFQASSSFL